MILTYERLADWQFGVVKWQVGIERIDEVLNPHAEASTLPKKNDRFSYVPSTLLDHKFIIFWIQGIYEIWIHVPNIDIGFEFVIREITNMWSK